MYCISRERKPDGLGRRRKITLHSLRRFVKTVISDQVGQDYSKWFLGHTKSPYYTKKEIDRREIYATKCMKYLTFLDYTTLEARGKGIEAKLREKDREIHDMKEKYETEIESIREETNQKFNQIVAMIQQIPQLVQIKPEVLIETTDCSIKTIPLQPCSVAEFYQETMAALESLEMPVTTWTIPVEVPDRTKKNENKWYQSFS